MKRISIVLICLILIVSSLSVGCNGCNSCKGSENGTEDYNKEAIFNDGIHIFDIKETDNYIVKDGLSDYKIVVTREMSNIEEFALSELHNFFYTATSVKLPVVYDDETYFDKNAKLISLGKNGIFETAGISCDGYDLGKQGCAIKTFYQSVFIFGKEERGTLYGVYDFLEGLFNFDCFSNTSCYIDTGIKEVKLYNYNVVDIPDITLRAGGNSITNNFSDTMYRMRFCGRDEENFVGSSSAHTALTHYFKPEIYNNPEDVENFHPKWYNSTATQLCYTAHGDQEEYSLMVDELAKLMIENYKANPKACLCVFGQEDNAPLCECETCKSVKAQYGGVNSAAIVKFCNKVSEKISEWMETEDGKPYARDFQILMLAYQNTVPAPVKFENGVYIPYDDSVVCNDHVSVFLAAGEMDYQVSVTSQINKLFYESLCGWRVLTKHINIYKYQCNYNYFFIPYDTFNAMHEYYQYAAKAGAEFLFDEGQRSNSSGETGWMVLKNYLNSKLGWNVNADLTAYTDKFFKYYFGDGAESMRKYYEEYRIHSKNLIDNFSGISRTNSCYATVLQQQYWPKPLLDGWYGYLSQAIEDIAYLKVVNPEKYQEYYDHITLERISVVYLMTELYGNRYEKEFLNGIKYDCKTDCARLGIEFYPGSIDSLWEKWGIQ